MDTPMTDTEFVPLAEVEVEMTVGELRAVLAAHQPAHDVAKLAERLRHPVAEHWLKDAADAADTIDRLTKERDEARRLVGLARRLAGAVQRFRNLPGLERSKLRETPEYHDLCERWRVFQEADSAALKEAER